MKNKNLKKFYEEVDNSEKLKKILFDGVKRVQTIDELVKFINKKIIPEAEKLGYEFTVEEFLEYEKEVVKHLSARDLKNVSGGALVKPMIAGSLTALAFFSSLNLNKVGAMLGGKDNNLVKIEGSASKVQIDNSGDSHTGTSPTQENQTQEVEQQESSNENVTQDLQISGEDADSNINVVDETSQDTQEVIEPQTATISKDGSDNVVVTYRNSSNDVLKREEFDNLDLPNEFAPLNIFDDDVFEEGAPQGLNFSNDVELKDLQIEENTFKYTDNFKSFILLGDFETLKIGYDAFAESLIQMLDLSQCSRLKNLYIGAEAFSGCNNLKRIIFPKNIETLEIDDGAFEKSSIKELDLSDCDKLKSLKIEWEAFKETYDLECIYLPESLEAMDIGGSAFEDSSIERINFSKCHNLKNLDVEFNAFHNSHIRKLEDFINLYDFPSLKTNVSWHDFDEDPFGDTAPDDGEY